MYQETVVKESRFTAWLIFEVSTFLHKHVPETVVKESHPKARISLEVPTYRETAVKESRLRPDSHEVSRQALTRYQKLSSKKLHRKHPAAVGPVYVTKPGTSA